MRILVIVAGTNDPSNAETLADHFIEGVREVPGAEVEKMRLRELHWEHFDLEHYNGRAPGEGFDRVRSVMEGCSGLAIATPIWNFSVPAHLKNFIDHVGSFALDEYTRSKGQLKGLPCFFLFTGGAPKVAWKGLMRFTTLHVPEAMRYFGASITGIHYEGKCMEGRGKFAEVVHERPDALAAARKRGEKFARLVQRFVETGTLPLYYRILGKLYRFGQRVLAKL